MKKMRVKFLSKVQEKLSRFRLFLMTTDFKTKIFRNEKTFDLNKDVKLSKKMKNRPNYNFQKSHYANTKEV